MSLLITATDWLWSYILIGVLLAIGVRFTLGSRGVQLRLFKRTLAVFSSIEWQGSDADEKGLDSNGHCIVAVDPRYFRPTEVETLLGDPSNAKRKLGWTPKITFEELVAEMVREDLKSAQRDELIKRHDDASMYYSE